MEHDIYMHSYKCYIFLPIDARNTIEQLVKFVQNPPGEKTLKLNCCSL